MKLDPHSGQSREGAESRISQQREAGDFLRGNNAYCCIISFLIRINTVSRSLLIKRLLDYFLEPLNFLLKFIFHKWDNG